MTPEHIELIVVAASWLVFGLWVGYQLGVRRGRSHQREALLLLAQTKKLHSMIEVEQVVLYQMRVSWLRLTDRPQEDENEGEEWKRP